LQPHLALGRGEDDAGGGARFAARDLDYQVIVVRDGLTGYEPQRTFFADNVFPRMCRVRTVDETIAMFTE
jgi:nicotinamidase-related amidase